MRPRGLDHLAINVHLLVLSGKLHPIQEHELRAVKADSLRPALRNEGQILGQLNIGRENNVPSVSGVRRSVAQGL